jgi:hypothetical protein
MLLKQIFEYRGKKLPFHFRKLFENPEGFSYKNGDIFVDGLRNIFASTVSIFYKIT